AMSHRINKLEEGLGIALFTRSHRKITLTEEVERIYLHVLMHSVSRLTA
ncbi:LysR family transcriptional regulator, partial [Vibrio sp. D173a]|nr:LysR family transcriptional regulator [Vibrio sp. D173a]